MITFKQLQDLVGKTVFKVYDGYLDDGTPFEIQECNSITIEENEICVCWDCYAMSYNEMTFPEANHLFPTKEAAIKYIIQQHIDRLNCEKEMFETQLEHWKGELENV